MSFVRHHLSRTPKYDVYSDCEPWNANQAELDSAGPVVHGGEEGTRPPIHSTPISTTLPPPLSRVTSTVDYSSSSSSGSLSTPGVRKKKKVENKGVTESRETQNHLEIQQRAGWWKEILKSGNSSSESTSGTVLAGTEPFQYDTFSTSVAATSVSSVVSDSYSVSTATPITTHTTGTTVHHSDSSSTATPVTTSTPATSILHTDTPVTTCSVASRGHVSVSTTSTTGIFKVPLGPVASTRTPSSTRSNFTTPSSGRSKTPGSGRIRTPGTGRTNSSATPGSSHTRTPGSGRSRTPGSAASRTPHTTQDLPPSTIIGVVEGRGQARGEVGMAAIDLRCPQLTLAQFSDTHTYTQTLTKLAILNPLEVVVATTAVYPGSEAMAGVGTRGGAGGGLMRVVQECAPEVPVTAVHRRYFNDNRGLAVVKHLAAHHCSFVTRQVANRYYCLAATAAVMKYVEHVQHVTYAPHSLHIMLTSSENTVAIDYWSCRKLEVVSSLRGGWQDSLLGALRHTRTQPGTRKLRAALLQPLSEISSIGARHNAIQYLAENCDLFYTLQSILGRFPDIDWILSMCVQLPKEDTEQRCEMRLNYVIALKNTLELLEPLAKALESATDPLLASVRETVSSPVLNELLEVLRGVLHEDARLVKGAAAMRTLRCYAIKSSVNGLLDVARKIYSEIIDDITEYVDAVGREHAVCVRVGHNAARGFHITIPIPKRTPAPRLGHPFIQVQRGRGCITCTTEHLYQLDQRSRDTLREILIMSNVIVVEVLEEARGRVGALHDLGEAVSTLDMLVALAHVASLGCWVRPEFSRVLAIRNGRHPILDLLSPEPPVPNNTFLSPESNVMVVTGPNMSGKSTYLRQIALIQILAQIGSFVPAEFASLRLVKEIFTHLGCEDAPENNASTFQVQMSEVAYMLGGGLIGEEEEEDDEREVARDTDRQRTVRRREEEREEGDEGGRIRGETGETRGEEGSRGREEKRRGERERRENTRERQDRGSSKRRRADEDRRTNGPTAGERRIPGTGIGAGPNSLVVLDELGCGTSVEEGSGLAWAVVEALTHARATTLLATHALCLTRLAHLYPPVTNYHLESETGPGGRLVLSHVVRKGITTATHYGLSSLPSHPPTIHPPAGQPHRSNHDTAGTDACGGGGGGSPPRCLPPGPPSHGFGAVHITPLPLQIPDQPLHIHRLSLHPASKSLILHFAPVFVQLASLPSTSASDHSPSLIHHSPSTSHNSPVISLHSPSTPRPSGSQDTHSTEHCSPSSPIVPHHSPASSRNFPTSPHQIKTTSGRLTPTFSREHPTSIHHPPATDDPDPVSANSTFASLHSQKSSKNLHIPQVAHFQPHSSPHNSSTPHPISSTSLHNFSTSLNGSSTSLPQLAPTQKFHSIPSSPTNSCASAT